MLISETAALQSIQRHIIALIVVSRAEVEGIVKSILNYSRWWLSLVRSRAGGKSAFQLIELEFASLMHLAEYFGIDEVEDMTRISEIFGALNLPMKPHICVV